jgi:hypothetical protein
MEALKFIFSSFWVWVGFMLMINLILYFIVNLIHKMYCKRVKHKTLRMIGYPPEHCDADGDPIQEIEDD